MQREWYISPARRDEYSGPQLVCVKEHTRSAGQGPRSGRTFAGAIPESGMHATLAELTCVTQA